MSRLYGKLISDRRKTDATAGANESLTTRLSWGSAKNPQLAINIALEWYKGKERPNLYICLGDDINYAIVVEDGTDIVSKVV